MTTPAEMIPIMAGLNARSVPPKDLTPGQLREWSIAWENAIGFDSIRTMEHKYERTKNGAYKCVWPDCKYAVYDPVRLWKHVHFSKSALHRTNR